VRQGRTTLSANHIIDAYPHKSSSMPFSNPEYYTIQLLQVFSILQQHQLKATSTDVSLTSKTTSSKMAIPFTYIPLSPKVVNNRRLRKIKKRAAKMRKECSVWCSDWFAHVQNPDRQQYRWAWGKRG
jgi:hypothetical protein